MIDGTPARLLRVALLAALAVAARPAAAQSGDRRDLVAMVRARYPDGQTDFGAAIVVHQTPARITLITADHVVRQNDAKAELTVEFNSLRDRRFSARLSSYSAREKGLDLAVLFVEEKNAPTVLGEDLLSSVSFVPPASLVGHKAVIVGFMNNRPWDQSLTGEPIVRASTLEIEVASNAVARGASGGGMFDAESGALIGMVVEDAEKRARARPIGILLDKLNEWHLDANIARPPPSAQASGSPLALEARAPSGLAMWRMKHLGHIDATVVRRPQDGSKWLIQVTTNPFGVRRGYDTNVQMVMKSGVRQWPVQLSRPEQLSVLEKRDALVDELGSEAVICLTARTASDQPTRMTQRFKIEKEPDGSFVPSGPPTVAPASYAPCQ